MTKLQPSMPTSSLGPLSYQVPLPTPTLSDLLAENARPIKSLTDLRQLIQGAISLEFAAIAPCMTALWSIRQPDSAVASFIHGRVFQKLAQVYQMANLMLSVGGVPKFSGTHTPIYPCRLPASQPDALLTLRLSAADHQFYGMLLPLLAPDSQAETPLDDAPIETVGQFYKLIEDGLVTLEEQAQLQGETIFGTTAGYRQASEMGYGVAEYPLQQVTNLMQAHQVLRQLIGQVEGVVVPPVPFELVALGQADATLPETAVLADAAYAEQWSVTAQALVTVFDGCYSELVRVLERSFETDEKMHQRYLKIAKPLMRDVLPALAQLLMQLPVERSAKEHALPLWQYSLNSLAQTRQQAQQLRLVLEDEALVALEPVIQQLEGLE